MSWALKSLRTVLGLFALLGLLCPIGCVKEEDPRPFSTGDSCYPGDVLDCVCDDAGNRAAVGTRACPKSGHFLDSACDCATGAGGGSK